MAAFTITKAYADGTALTETHIDNFRNALLTYLNTTKLVAANFDPAAVITAAKMTGTELTDTDTEYITFGATADGYIGTDADKSLVIGTNASDELVFTANDEVLTMSASAITIEKDFEIKKGGTTHTVLQIVSQAIRKPNLYWGGTSYVALARNHPTAFTTTVVFPTAIAEVTESGGASSKYRQCSIDVEANGYLTSHTGDARGGRRVGLAKTTNKWYAVYAVLLRAGNDYSATSAKFVLLIDDTLPTPANESTLDSYYGEGGWVYMGLIRYGYGADGNSARIIKFTYSNKGWCYLHGNDSGATYAGLQLANDEDDEDNTASAFYTVANGMAGNVIPETISHAQFSVGREYVSDWYVKDTSGDIMWRGGWQTKNAAHPSGFVMDLPCYSGMGFYQERKSNGAVNKRVALTGFCDSYLAIRRQGKGI
jgi:hypothetical protein